MAFDLQTLEGLIHEPEGTALDFKQEQYRFVGEDDFTKSELLKDILAFANSWRRQTAYILIGVKEVKGGRSEIIGVGCHLDDANLHQFVNSKTQRPVDFSYFQFKVQSVEIGVIEIPVQMRPIFLQKKFGKVDEGAVWTRDGSSSKKVDPDEIAKMGAASVINSEPQFTLDWADLENRKTFPLSYKVASLALDPVLPLDTFQPSQPGGLIHTYSINPDYSMELITYVAKRSFFAPLGFHLQNTSSTAGKRIRFVGHVVKTEGIILVDWIEDIPSARNDFLVPHIADFGVFKDEAADLLLKDLGDRWEIIVDFGNVRPHDESWTASPFYVGSTVSTLLTLKGELLGDNLSEPLVCELQCGIEAERKAMTDDDVLPFLRLG